MQQVFERGGTIEIAVARPGAVDAPTIDPMESAGAADLVWRLKIVDLQEETMLVEAPVALGKTMPIEDGIAIVGAITIGQNRWKFKSKKLTDERPEGARVVCMRLSLPDHVERCLRRYVRMEARTQGSGNVKIWPLLDPKSVVAAERANEEAFKAITDGKPMPASPGLHPVLGPAFTATLMNVGGGGVGIRVEPSEASAFAHHRIFWLEVPLGTSQPVPIVATGKVVHTHLDSSQRTYAGISFDFTFNLPHQAVVVEQIHRAMKDSQHNTEN